MYIFVDGRDQPWLAKEQLISCLKLFCATISCITLSPHMASCMIIGFVGFDIIDGPTAKKSAHWIPENDLYRRRFDSFSDLIVSNGVSLYHFYHTDTSLWWYVALVFRECCIAGFASRVFLKSGTTIFPGTYHKGAKLLFALAGIAVIQQQYVTLFLSIAYGALYITLIDYAGLFKGYTKRDISKPEHIDAVYLSNFGGLKYLWDSYTNPHPSITTNVKHTYLPQNTEENG